MHNHPLTCRGCGEYAELPGGCECPEAEPEMAELEHLPASMSMTGAGFHALELRTGFASEALDAPWLLPRGGIVVDEWHGVADSVVEREQDNDERLLERAAEIEAGELCREAA